MLKNKSNKSKRSLHQPYSCRSDHVLVLGIRVIMLWEKWCFNIKETNTFQSFGNKKVYEIHHHFHCDSKCIIYLLSCKVCGLQYVSSAINRVRLRWNNYKSSHRVGLEGGAPKQNYIHQNFLSEDHGLPEDYEITFSEKTF